MPGNAPQATAGAERMRPAAWYVHGTLQGNSVTRAEDHLSDRLSQRAGGQEHGKKTAPPGHPQSPAFGAVFCCGSGSPVRLKWTGDGSKADRSGPKVDRRKIKCGSGRAGDRSNGGQPCVRFDSDVDRACVESGPSLCRRRIGCGSDVDRTCVESGSGMCQKRTEHVSEVDRARVRSGSTVGQGWIERVRETEGKTGRQNFVRDLQLNQHGFNGIIRKKRSMDRLQMTGE